MQGISPSLYTCLQCLQSNLPKTRPTLPGFWRSGAPAGVEEAAPDIELWFGTFSHLAMILAIVCNMILVYLYVMWFWLKLKWGTVGFNVLMEPFWCKARLAEKLPTNIFYRIGSLIYFLWENASLNYSADLNLTWPYEKNQRKTKGLQSDISKYPIVNLKVWNPLSDAIFQTWNYEHNQGNQGTYHKESKKNPKSLSQDLLKGYPKTMILGFHKKILEGEPELTWFHNSLNIIWFLNREDSSTISNPRKNTTKKTHPPKKIIHVF